MKNIVLVYGATYTAGGKRFEKNKQQAVADKLADYLLGLVDKSGDNKLFSVIGGASQSATDGDVEVSEGSLKEVAAGMKVAKLKTELSGLGVTIPPGANKSTLVNLYVSALEGTDYPTPVDTDDVVV